MMTTAPARYDRPSIAFHWVTAAVVAIAFTLGPGDFGELIKQGVDPGAKLDIVWHESLGALVFLLTLARLLWLLVRPNPPIADSARWMRLAARTAHIALWFLLLALPTTAMLGLFTEAIPLTLLGGVRINGAGLVANSFLSGLVDWGEVHKFLGTAMMWIAGLHAGAALFHHFKIKDGVLRSMLP